MSEENYEQTEATETVVSSKKKNTVLAYALAILFGAAGAHNFYLGRPWRGLLNLILLVLSFLPPVAGYIFIAVNALLILWDLITIPSAIRSQATQDRFRAYAENAPTATKGVASPLMKAAELRGRWVFAAAALGLIALSLGVVLKVRSSRQEGVTAEQPNGEAPTNSVETPPVSPALAPAAEAPTPTPAAEPVVPTPTPAADAPTPPPAAEPASPPPSPKVEPVSPTSTPAPAAEGSAPPPAADPEAPTPAPAKELPTSPPAAEPASPTPLPLTAVPTTPPADKPAAPTPTPLVKPPAAPSPPTTELRAPTSTPAVEAPKTRHKPVAKPATPTPRKSARKKRGADAIEISPQ